MKLLRIGLALALLLLSLAPSARAQDTRLDGIRATYQDMLELFYRPLPPGDLLRAGWGRLQSEAIREGAPAPDPLPDVSADPDAAFQTFAQAYAAYLANAPGLDSAASAMEVEAGMADSVHEAHTHVLSPSQYQRFLTTVSGGQQSIGLGIRLGNTPTGLITAVAPNGPAEQAGIKPGDVIVAVDGRDVSHADVGTLTAALSGDAGTPVQLTVDRGNGPQDITVMRGTYYFPPLESRVLPDGTGYLRLTDFVVPGTQLPDGTDILSDLDRDLDDFDAQGVQDIVLDLRDNGGGSVQTADEILGRFLPETARSVYEQDERGHQSYDLASGREHARQLPLAVLINGRSASASEITAAALHETQRAVLVGQRTAGALASSELLPLPGGGALQVAVAAASTPEAHTAIDGVGVAPDVVSSDSRGMDDYRTGRDPQLDAAVVALNGAPPPPPAQSTPPAIAPDELDALLQGVLPPESAIPANDRLTHITRWQRMTLTHPNQLIDQNGGAPDPLALQQVIRARGYQGSIVATYGNAAGDLPAVTVQADLYAAADGAHAATVTDDVPDLLQPVDAPLALGDETVAYRGTWIGDGTSALVWRRGRLVLTAAYSDVPGLDRPATLTAVAQTVDALAQNLTLP